MMHVSLNNPFLRFKRTLSADGLRFGLGIAGGHAFMSGIWACEKLSKLSIVLNLLESLLFEQYISSKAAVKQQ